MLPRWMEEGWVHFFLVGCGLEGLIQGSGMGYLRASCSHCHIIKDEKMVQSKWRGAVYNPGDM